MIEYYRSMVNSFAASATAVSNLAKCINNGERLFDQEWLKLQWSTAG